MWDKDRRAVWKKETSFVSLCCSLCVWGGSVKWLRLPFAHSAKCICKEDKRADSLSAWRSPCMVLVLCTARNGLTVCACVCYRLCVCVGGRHNVPTHGALHVGKRSSTAPEQGELVSLTSDLESDGLALSLWAMWNNVAFERHTLIVPRERLCVGCRIWLHVWVWRNFYSYDRLNKPPPYTPLLRLQLVRLSVCFRRSTLNTSQDALVELKGNNERSLVSISVLKDASHLSLTTFPFLMQCFLHWKKSHDTLLTEDIKKHTCDNMRF